MYRRLEVCLCRRYSNVCCREQTSVIRPPATVMSKTDRQKRRHGSWRSRQETRRQQCQHPLTRQHQQQQTSAAAVTARVFVRSFIRCVFTWMRPSQRRWKQPRARVFNEAKQLRAAGENRHIQKSYSVYRTYHSYDCYCNNNSKIHTGRRTMDINSANVAPHKETSRCKS